MGVLFLCCWQQWKRSGHSARVGHGVQTAVSIQPPKWVFEKYNCALGEGKCANERELSTLEGAQQELSAAPKTHVKLPVLISVPVCNDQDIKTEHYSEEGICHVIKDQFCRLSAMAIA